jgi:peptide/nickel transport system substrate-binding protein
MVACGPSAPRDPHTFYGLLRGEPNYLNYVPYVSAYEAQAISPIYTPLFEMDLNDNNRLIPALATNITTHADRRTFTVNMRQDAVWEDGEPVTARDVEFTWRMIIDPASGAQNKISSFGEIESITVYDDWNFTVRWKQANVNALMNLAGLVPIPEHIWRGRSMLDPELNRRPVGNGPWRFESWQTGRQITYTANPLWWGERKPFFTRIIFRIIPEEGSSLAALRKGSIDLIDTMRAITWLDFVDKFVDSDKNDRFGKLRNISTSYSLIAWQAKDNVFFSDARVRRAMTLSLDRESLLRNVFRGIGAIQSGPFYQGSWAEDAGIQPLPYDPVQAAKLLDEADWILDPQTGLRTKDGRVFRFEFLVPQGSENGRAIAVVLQGELRRLGVDMQIRTLEWSVFNKRLTERNFTAASFSWNNSVDCDIYDLWHSSMQNDGLNLIGYANAEVDALLEQARITFDMPGRIRIAHRLHRIISDEQPYTFLIASENLSLYNLRIENMKSSVRGVYSSWPGLLGWTAKTEIGISD